MDCPFNFCGLAVGLVRHGFLTNRKKVAETFFDVDKTEMKIC